MNRRWTHSKTTIFNISYHLIWCTKYRRDLLNEEIQERLKTLLNEKSLELGCDIQIQEVMTDHVHIFVKANPTLAPHYIVQQLKGYTSRILRQEFKSLRSRTPTLWTRSYYCESIGHISESVVKKYIENQKNV